MVTRFRAQYPGQTGVWFGTCPEWARPSNFQPGAVVTREAVMVVNPTLIPCGSCRGAHAALPAPSIANA